MSSRLALGVMSREIALFGRLSMLLSHEINRCLNNKSICNVMLTGGRSAACLYDVLRHHIKSESIKKINFYFSDERCVPADSSESNYGMVMKSLFFDTDICGLKIHRMDADTADLEAAADRYASFLPEAMDVLLLSMGEDGHIASLFPHCPVLSQTQRRVLPVTGPNPPFQRLTITPPVIQSARNVFVMALGEQKRAIYEEALRDPVDIDSIPARLVLNRTWIFGDSPWPAQA